MQYISGRRISQDFGVPGITTNDTVINVTGRVAVGIDSVGIGTSATADVDLNTIRIRKTILDYEGKDGQFGYYLVRDAEGIAWVAVPPIDSNAIFVSQDENIIGVSSFTGLNFVSRDDFFNIQTNANNSSFADINVDLRWLRDRVSSGGGIYTTSTVGIGSLIPRTSAGILTNVKLDIDGDVIISGILSAKTIYGDIDVITKDLYVAGVSTFVGLATFRNVGIGTTSNIGNDVLTIFGDTRLGGESDVFGVGTSIKMSSGIVTAIEFDGIFLDFDYLNVSIASTLGDAEARTLEVTGLSTFKDHVELEKTLRVAGVSTFQDDVKIENNLSVVGLSTFTEVGIGTTATIGDDVLTIFGNARLGGENDVLQIGNNISISSGIITANEFDGIFLDLDFLNVSIASTIGDADARSLEVTGLSTFKDHVELEKTIRVAGVSTFVGLSTFTEVGIGTTSTIESDVLTIFGDARLGGENDVFRVGSAITMSSGIVTAREFDGEKLTFDYLTVSIASTLGSAEARTLEVTGVSTFRDHVELEKTLTVTGVSTFVGLSTFTEVGIGTASTIGNDVLTISGDTRLSGENNVLRVGNEISLSNGIITAREFDGEKLTFDYLTVSIASTLGSAEARTLEVTGVSTFVGLSTFTEVGIGTASTIGNDVLTISGDTRLSGKNDVLRVGNDISISGGIVTANVFDGLELDFDYLNVSIASTLGNADATTLEVTGLSTFKNHVELEKTLRVSGVSTFLDYVDIKDTLGVTGVSTFKDHVELEKTLRVAGVSTFNNNVDIEGGLQVRDNLHVFGNITVGGTTAIIYAQEFRVTDKDVIVGYTTDLNGNLVSNDFTATAGGLAIASTEGNPLVSLQIAGINTLPDTYKQFLWFESGSFSGLGTDAWITNYAIGIGSTQIPNKVQLAVGKVQITDKDIINVRNIKSSGISTFGTLKIDSGIVTATSGTITYYGNLIGLAATASFATTAFSLNGVVESDLNVAFAATASFASTAFSLNGVVESDLNVASAATASFATTAFFLNGFDPNATEVAFATTSVNLKDGIGGNIPYQYDSGITSFIPNGSLGQVLLFDGSKPYWSNISAASGSGISVFDEETIVGGVNSITVLKFKGLNVNVTNSDNIATVTIAENLVGTSLSISGISTLGILEINSGIVSATSGTITYYGNLVGSASTASFAATAFTLNGISEGDLNVAFASTASFATTAFSLNGVREEDLSVAFANTSTNVKGGIASVTSLSVSGISTLGILEINSGIVSATSGIITYYGNIVGSASTASFASTAFSLNGIVESDLNVAFAATASFATTAFTLNGVKEPDLNVAFASTASFATTAFSLNGIIESDLNVAFATTSRDVKNGIATVTSLYVTGVGTFAKDSYINSFKIGRGKANVISNTIFGYQVLDVNTTGNKNVAVGYQVLKSNTTGYSNVALGYQALTSNLTSAFNVAIGDEALRSNTNGSYNVAIGSRALYTANNFAASNVAIGYAALSSNTTGKQNVAIGHIAMTSNLDSESNTAVGYGALRNNTSGYENSALGNNSAFSNTTGNRNNFYGTYSGRNNKTGNYNINFGSFTGLSESSSRKIIIGSGDEPSLYQYQYFDSPEPNKDIQLAIGHRIAGISSYWIVGDENFNIGIGVTNPSVKLDVGGNFKVSGIATIGTLEINSGIVTASSGIITYYGDGRFLTGVTGVKVQTQITTSNPTYPTLATGVGVNTVGISTSNLVFIPSLSRLGIGTTNPQYNLHVIGDFGATTKSFIIPHPTKQGMTLRHGSLEGPENGVYVRGKTTESKISLPNYWKGLVDEDTITVNLTSKNGKLHSVINSTNEYIEIECVGGEIDCYFMVLGERKDVEKLVVEY